MQVQVYLNLPITSFRPDKIRVTDSSNGMFVVVTEKNFLQDVTLAEHVKLEEAIQDALGWYKDPEVKTPEKSLASILDIATTVQSLEGTPGEATRYELASCMREIANEIKNLKGFS